MDALPAAGVMGIAILVVVQAVKWVWPQIQDNKARALTLALGPVVGYACYLLEAVDTSWRLAVLAGITAAFSASGGYAQFKGLKRPTDELG